jgi:thiol:disulfide interchange protein
MRLKLVLALCAAIGVLGCQAAPVAPAQEERAAERPKPNATAHSAMAWGDKITWHSWESAQAIAQSQSKPICVVVYAEWCARCKELAPIFSTQEVVSAAANLVMVHQDQDKPAPWLKDRLGEYGSYVPRVFFIAPNGDVREDLTSGHPRYPYFYAPMVSDQLIANMHAAKAR